VARRHTIEISSVVSATPEEVWALASTIAGVNAELRPLARMTHPRGFDRLDPELVPLGQRAFRSWILALGVLPIDYDDLTIVELEPGRRFLERSTMLSQRVWEHERVVEAAPGGCRVTDRVAFEPRVVWLGGLFALTFEAAFRNRHRRLRRIHGGRR
jgi:ligand-binding SRPBCC domain-containing protein